jgi:hypothetical protein
MLRVFPLKLTEAVMGKTGPPLGLPEKFPAELTEKGKVFPLLSLTVTTAPAALEP